MNSREISQIEINAFLAAHNEWLLQYKFGKSFALRASEIETEIFNNKLLFSFLDDKGVQSWRVKRHEIKDEKLFLDLTRNFERENANLVLIPRVSAGQLGASVELARIEKANRIAALIKETRPQIKITRVRLNKENGRLAQIEFDAPNNIHLAAIADVSGALTPEILISNSILQLAKLQRRKKNPVGRIWITAEKKTAKKTQKLHALLRESWKSRIKIFEISTGGEKEKFAPLESLEIDGLWSAKAGRMRVFENYRSGDTAREIVKLAPEKIDVIFSGCGETLRFHGLAFARVRRVLEKEKVWFGTGKEKCVLSEKNESEFFHLLETLEKYRRFDSPNKRHGFYQSAPEAWLESIIRRNTKRLDANLVLSPVYHQFRAGREKIDLLALRRDGRLVIIEIKTAPDREMVFQAADYWRKIELRRRTGDLARARVFGDLKIADRPAVCYLVAPTLAFHREFDFLSHALSEKIEMHRFNLAENWRANLKVLERLKTL